MCLIFTEKDISINYWNIEAYKQRKLAINNVAINKYHSSDVS